MTDVSRLLRADVVAKRLAKLAGLDAEDVVLMAIANARVNVSVGPADGCWGDIALEQSLTYVVPPLHHEPDWELYSGEDVISIRQIRIYLHGELLTVARAAELCDALEAGAIEASSLMQTNWSGRQGAEALAAARLSPDASSTRTPSTRRVS